MLLATLPSPNCSRVFICSSRYCRRPKPQPPPLFAACFPPQNRTSRVRVSKNKKNTTEILFARRQKERKLERARAKQARRELKTIEQKHATIWKYPKKKRTKPLAGRFFFFFEFNFLSRVSLSFATTTTVDIKSKKHKTVSQQTKRKRGAAAPPTPVVSLLRGLLVFILLLFFLY